VDRRAKVELFPRIRLRNEGRSTRKVSGPRWLAAWDSKPLERGLPIEMWKASSR
jgi:hypothetical protein